MVRASGTDQARSVAEDVQLITRVSLSHRLTLTAQPARFPGCMITVRPVADENDYAGNRTGLVVVTVAVHRLSIGFAELRPLMFQPVPMERALDTLFGSAITQLLTTSMQVGLLDDHGVARYLTGLVELMLRSVLRRQLDRADTAAARYRAAIEYVNRHLADPELTAERVADALFISRRRLYQLFDDGEGISGRIRRLRIERVKELLADPTRAHYGIGELSRQCGFVNSQHFSRTFRKIVGQTPREFREHSLHATVQPAVVVPAVPRDSRRPEPR